MELYVGIMDQLKKKVSSQTDMDSSFSKTQCSPALCITGRSSDLRIQCESECDCCFQPTWKGCLNHTVHSKSVEVKCTILNKGWQRDTHRFGDSLLTWLLDRFCPLSNSLAASSLSWKGEILSSLLVSFSLLCWCMAGTVRVLWHDARYLKCRPGSFCASEVERCDCFTCLNICTYTWCQHTGLHTLTYQHTPGDMCTDMY